ncbi:MAG: hypothetical protein PHW87_00845 [Methanothrix sp.]|nr:hypothetical protein [Methanothrix sp.]
MAISQKRVEMMAVMTEHICPRTKIVTNMITPLGSSSLTTPLMKLWKASWP